MTTFYNCLRPSGEPVPWLPGQPVAGTKLDTAYFGRALSAMDADLAVSGLTVFLTDDVHRLPALGPDIVVVLVGDELSRIPPYAADVRAIFKNMSVRPRLDRPPLASSKAGSIGYLLAYARSVVAWAPGRLRLSGAELAANAGRRGPVGLVYEVPLGTLNLAELPLRAWSDRSSAIFFAGSVQHTSRSRENWRSRVAPKSVSRSGMLTALAELQRNQPDLRVDLQLTVDFQASAGADPDDYSRRLMDSRIALCPRGATPETSRFLQALKYGCIVVADSVPSSWYYRQAPVVELTDWNVMPKVLPDLLGDEGRLHALHVDGLRWWEQSCSERAVGQYMARMLNAQVSS